MLNDVARIQLVRVALRAEDHGGLQRTSAAGGSVRDEVEIGKPLGVGVEVRGRGRLLPFQHFAILVWKVVLDFVHFRGSLRESRKISVGLLSIADKEEALFFCCGARG